MKIPNLNLLRQKFVKKIRQKGFISTLNQICCFSYRELLRPHLPTTGYQIRNGVKIKTVKQKLFDSCLPNREWHGGSLNLPKTEEGLVSLHKQFTKPRIL